MLIQPRPYGSDTLVIGVDIAKASHVAVAQLPDLSCSKPLVFGNDRKGFDAFAAWLGQVAAKAGTPKVIVALEPTGHYWKPLGEFLGGLSVEIRMVSTVLTKRAKDMLDGSPLKTDAKDARVIADLARMGKSRPLYVHGAAIQEIRYMVELRERIIRDRTAALNRLHRLLDILFPELLGMFSKIECKSILALLEVAPTPVAALQAGLPALTAVLEKASNRYYGSAKALEILDAAETSIGCTEGTDPLIFETLIVVPRIRKQYALIAVIEKELAKLLGRVDFGPLLLTIPGFAVVTASVVIAELGDLRLYRHARQLIKMAGLNLFERSSGRQHGQKRITKRGRSLLRKILYLAVIRQAGPKGMYGDYVQKHASSKPKPKIVVAAMRRLLRLIFAIVREGKAYTKPIANSVAESRPMQEAA